MALKIRLKRMGAKKRPFYRIVVAEEHTGRNGKFVEHLGYFSPLTEPTTLKIEEDKIINWLSKGAKPTDTVKILLSSTGTMNKYIEQKKSIKKENQKQVN